MYFSKDADAVPTFESPWIHQGWTPAEVDFFRLREKHTPQGVVSFFELGDFIC